MDKKATAALIQRYLRGECTPDEAARVETWYNRTVADKGEDLAAWDYGRIQEESLAGIHRRIGDNTGGKVKVVRWHLPRIAAAAVLLVALGAGGYWGYHRMIPAAAPQAVASVPHQILPGGNRAYLTLPDGTMIPLNESREGIAMHDTGITYDDGSTVEGMEVAPVSRMLVLSTPLGGQYRVTLPDGSNVWLNAGSTLQYPERFENGSREVALEGEAFFDIVSARTPFAVRTGGQLVEVLGTQFNVNAYRDNDLAKTTLLEGRVKVSSQPGNPGSAKREILVPNQQAVTRTGDTDISVTNVDATNAVAWKNGYFAFDNEHLTEVMKTIARWYDIDVVYEGDTSEKFFKGTLSRYESFEKLLDAIGLTGSVRFKIEGRRVTVMS